MEEYIGMIATFPNSFIPEGFVACNGQELLVNSYQALFSLIGYTYGGNNRDIFRVPDLRGRSILGTGTGYGLTPRTIGGFGGEEVVGLSYSHIPPHRHQYYALTGPRESKQPAQNYIGTAAGTFYAKQDLVDTLIEMSPAIIQPATGGNKAHENMAPFLCITYAICWNGIYPYRPD